MRCRNTKNIKVETNFLLNFHYVNQSKKKPFVAISTKTYPVKFHQNYISANCLEKTDCSITNI